MYDAIVFDVDGVLLRWHEDRPDVYDDAVAAAFRAFGVNPSRSDREPFVGASKSIPEMRRVCERHDIDVAAFWAEREHQSSKLQRELIERGERDLYGDAAVVSALADTHSLGLVSSNQHETVEFVLDHFGLEGCFDAVYGRRPTIEGYRRIKPDTHYIESALADLHTRSALYVGDSASDVIAAHRAEIDSAFVWRDHRRGDELPEEPTHEIDQLTDLTDITTAR